MSSAIASSDRRQFVWGDVFSFQVGFGWRDGRSVEDPFGRLAQLLRVVSFLGQSTGPILIIVETDPGVGQCASQFRESVNRLPLAASLSPPHFASSFDDPCMLKFSHSCVYFIDHVDLPSLSLVAAAREHTRPGAANSSVRDVKHAANSGVQ